MVTGYLSLTVGGYVKTKITHRCTALGDDIMAWSHRITEIECRPAQILIDDRFRASAPVHELPRLAWFAVYCQLDPGASFWNPEESANLDAVEGLLVKLWDELGHGFAVFVMRIATRGIREYYVYAGNAASSSEVFSRLKTAHSDYRIEFEEIADPTWQRYKSCLPAT